jgi:hypothetical protein
MPSGRSVGLLKFPALTKPAAGHKGEHVASFFNDADPLKPSKGEHVASFFNDADPLKDL